MHGFTRPIHSARVVSAPRPATFRFVWQTTVISISLQTRWSRRSFTTEMVRLFRGLLHAQMRTHQRGGPTAHQAACGPSATGQCAGVEVDKHHAAAVRVFSQTCATVAEAATHEIVGGPSGRLGAAQGPTRRIVDTALESVTSKPCRTDVFPTCAMRAFITCEAWRRLPRDPRAQQRRASPWRSSLPLRVPRPLPTQAARRYGKYGLCTNRP